MNAAPGSVLSASSAPVLSAPDLSGIQRVLICKLRYHGDVLLSLPVVEYLKRHYPGLSIDMLVYRETAPLLVDHPAIAQVHSIDRNWKKLRWWQQCRHEAQLLGQLRRRRYDLFIHLTEDWRGVILQQCLRIPTAVTGDYPRRQGSRWWRRNFTHRYPVVSSQRHMVDRQADALRALGCKVTAAELRLHFYPQAAAVSVVEQRLKQASLNAQPYVQLHPGSRFFHKVWPAQKVAELCDRLALAGWPVILTGAPDARELAYTKSVLAAAKHPPVNWVGELSLPELAELTRRAHTFVGVDSAPAHLAAAVDTPAVVLFGPTSSAVWRPWNNTVQIVTAGMHCQPCSQKGCQNSGVSECLTTLSVDRVWQALQPLLSPGQPDQVVSA